FPLDTFCEGGRNGAFTPIPTTSHPNPARGDFARHVARRPAATRDPRTWGMARRKRLCCWCTTYRVRRARPHRRDTRRRGALMARFTDEQLDRVKREVSIADLVRRRGVELRGHGENLIGLCPFHDDHDPSLVVTPSKSLWNCLGACQRGGDVIRWVEVSERVSFRRAVELLIGGYEPSSQPQRWARKADARCPVTEEMSDAEMLASVAGYYNHVLHTSDDAKKYLERRAVLSDETIEHFQIGFADRSLGTLLPSPELRSGKELRARLAKLGIYR